MMPDAEKRAKAIENGNIPIEWQKRAYRGESAEALLEEQNHKDASDADNNGQSVAVSVQDSQPQVPYDPQDRIMSSALDVLNIVQSNDDILEDLNPASKINLTILGALLAEKGLVQSPHD
jgi:hypothetical protein